MFVVARVRNSEMRKEITLNTFTLHREKSEIYVLALKMAGRG